MTDSFQNSPYQLLSGLIQISAGVDPGDVGGSLVNAHGSVIGIEIGGAGSSSAIPVADVLTMITARRAEMAALGNER